MQWLRPAVVGAAALVCGLSGFPGPGAGAGLGGSDGRPPTQLADSHEWGEDEGPMPGTAAKAVGKFDAIGAFTARYGNWDIGGGLSAMMTSARVESGRFIVVERLTDPAANEVLSIRKKEPGIVQISGVEKKISYGPFMPLGVDPPQRGDFVAVMR